MHHFFKNSFELLGAPMFDEDCFKNFPQKFEHKWR